MRRHRMKHLFNLFPWAASASSPLEEAMLVSYKSCPGFFMHINKNTNIYSHPLSLYKCYHIYNVLCFAFLMFFGDFFLILPLAAYECLFPHRICYQTFRFTSFSQIMHGSMQLSFVFLTIVLTLHFCFYKYFCQFVDLHMVEFLVSYRRVLQNIFVLEFINAFFYGLIF